jgi:hypothetical protein
MTRILILIVTLLHASAAYAQGDADARARAKELYLKGEEHMAAGRFDRAIVAYQAAYKIAPAPGLLYNLGQAYRRHGDRQAALQHFERYLAADPKGKVAPQARTNIAELRAEIAAEEAKAAEVAKKAADEEARKQAEEEAARKQAEEEAKRKAEAEAAEKARAAELRRERAEDPELRRDTDDKVAEEPEIVDREPEPVIVMDAHPGQGRRRAGLIAGGAGILALGLGGYFGINDAAPPTHDASPDARDLIFPCEGDVNDRIGLWRFDEGTGTETADDSTEDNDLSWATGVANPPTWETGCPYGDCLRFHGDPLTTPVNLLGENDDALTVEYYVRVTPPAENSTFNVLELVGTDTGYWNEIASDGLVSAHVDPQGAPPVTVALNLTDQISDGAFHCVAIVYDHGTVYAYFDGEPSGENVDPAAIGFLPSYVTEIRIGGQEGMVLDDLQIHACARPANDNFCE